MSVFSYPRTDLALSQPNKNRVLPVTPAKQTWNETEFAGWIQVCSLDKCCSIIINHAIQQRLKESINNDEVVAPKYLHNNDVALVENAFVI